MINPNDQAHGLKPLDLRKPSEGSSAEMERLEESKDQSEEDIVVNP